MTVNWSSLPLVLLLEGIIFTVLLVPTLRALWNAPFVPSKMSQVQRMMNASDLKPGMKVYDLGAGDGRFIHEASKICGSSAIGYEYSPLVYLGAKLRLFLKKSQARVLYGNFWKHRFEDADVIFCFLMPDPMREIQEKIWPFLKEGALLISHAFPLPGIVPLEKLPGDPIQRLAPVWIYKKEAKFHPTKDN